MIQHWERHRFADEKNCSNDDSDDYDGDEDEVEEQTFPSDKLTNLSWHPYCEDDDYVAHGTAVLDQNACTKQMSFVESCLHG